MEIFAYLDPGTGSIIIQAVIGAVAGAAFIFRNAVKQAGVKLTSIFKKTTQDNKKTK